MLLSKIQNQFATLYETPLAYDILDFLITDSKVARALSPTEHHDNKERLLISQQNGELELSVYVDAEAISHLNADNPFVILHDGNLAAFLLALEGVSHFNYLCWNATYEKPVTLLELELQAEVDKYVAVTSLLEAQGNRSSSVHQRLFDDVHFHQDLNTEHRTRYRDANYYAGKYCRTLSDNFPIDDSHAPFVKELRHFYRLTQNQKIRRIETSRDY